MRILLSALGCFSRLRTVVQGSFFILALLAVRVHATNAQVPREPDYEAMNNADQDAQNRQAVDRIKNEQQGKYRGGSESFSEVKNNMTRLLKPILFGQGGNVDKWYSPHLRDILTPLWERIEILPYRFMAGASIIVPTPLCTFCFNGVGLPWTACPQCQPENGGCPWQRWFDKHVTPTCCEKNTARYLERVTDANFKTCCVRKEDRTESTEEISCRHVDGSGWAGIFEYYYPTTIIGWENSRTTTMIADKNEVRQCVQQAGSKMHQEASTWVDKAIKKNLEVADKLGGSSGGKSDSSGLQQKIQDSLQVVNSIEQKNQFADSLAGEGLTMRVNFPAMDPAYRRRLARHFCMREDQFMKLMDGDGGEGEDKLQKGGGKTEEQLKGIPIWANYCPQGVQLMTDPDETKRCVNIDKTDTDFVKGMSAWDKDPLFCQRMNLSNPKMQEYFGETLSKSGGSRLSEAAVGYTCRDGGKLNGSMVPVELYRHTPVERRSAISDHVLGFLIAGGLYGEMLQGKKSFYKRFEQMPYSQRFGMFTGRPFYGSASGPVNEVDMPCEGVNPEVYTGRNKSDQLFISDQTHPTRAFTGETQMIHESSPKEFNRYVQEWSKSGQDKTIPRRAVDDGQDDKSANYAAAFRIFATCPSKYVRWHPLDVHDELIQERCGDENFGGDMTGIPNF
jgi:hypothetical protein